MRRQLAVHGAAAVTALMLAITPAVWAQEQSGSRGSEGSGSRTQQSQHDQASEQSRRAQSETTLHEHGTKKHSSGAAHQPHHGGQLGESGTHSESARHRTERVEGLQPGQRQEQGEFASPEQSREEQEQQAWLGVVVSESDRGEGLKVDHIFPAGPAARSGLRTGDIIVRVSDKPVKSAEEISEVIGKAKPGEQIEIAVKRGESESKQKVRLGNRFDFLARMTQQQQGEGSEGEWEGGFEDQGMFPEYLMRLEQERCFAEQHERLEGLMSQLVEEVSQLRKEIQQLKAVSSASSQNAPGTTSNIR
jgi:hypothetical protein